MSLALIEHFKKYIDLEPKDTEYICEHLETLHLSNKEYIQEADQICKSYYFVEKGCLRMFFVNEKGVEQTTQFAIKNWWIADYFSILDQKTSAYYIQAVGKSTVVKINHQSFDHLLNQIPALERYFRIIMQRAVAASQLRMKLLFSLSKEDLYLHFSSYFSEFSQQVPQYMIASYLGLTPEYVSEIRKKKK